MNIRKTILLAIAAVMLQAAVGCEEKKSEAGRLYTLTAAVPQEEGNFIDSDHRFTLTAALAPDREAAAGAQPRPSAALPVRAASENRETAAVHSFYSRMRETEERLAAASASGRAAGASRFRIADGRSGVRSVTEGSICYGFRVLDGNGVSHSVDAVCRRVSRYAAVYVDTAVTVDSAALEVVTAEFDRMVPEMHRLFSHESDIDGNGTVLFLLTPLEPGLYGYFYAQDKYPDGTGGEFSNEADLLYVNSDCFADFETHRDDLIATFIHEFQHMILFDHRTRLGKPQLPVWLNEGLSMLSEYYAGYALPHGRYLEALFENQGISLIENQPFPLPNYGYSLLFLRYLRERWGDNVVRRIYDSPFSGVAVVSDATGVEFNTLFSDFTTMIAVTGRGIEQDERYEIAAFGHEPGSEAYRKNGFHLARLIDDLYRRKRGSGWPLSVDLTKKSGIREDMLSYSFYLHEWLNGTVSSFGFESDGTVLFREVRY